MKRNLRQIKLVSVKRQITDLDQPRSSGRIIKGSSFYRIPAVGKYILGARHHNPILKTIGITKQMKTSPSKVRVNKNNKMNRYMARTIIKIRKLLVEERNLEA